MLLPIVATALICLLLGLPVALFTRRTIDGPVALGADGLIFGFVLLALSPTLYAWIGVTGLVLLGLAWLVAVVFAVVRRPRWPRFARLDGRGIVLLLLALAIAAVALLFRLHNDNFLPWLGDMGAYVNWANEFARTGQLSATWPPLLSSFLALSSWAFGAAATTANLGVAGLILIVAVCRVLNLFGVNRWLLLLIAGLIAVNVHAIWYSDFPSSEALDAPMYVTWLATIVGTVRAKNRAPWLAVSGATLLALGLTRGTGPFLLVPLAILAVFTLLVRQWRFLARPVWQLFAVGVAGSVLAYWYGISRIPGYYVDTQFRSLVPSSIANLFQYKLHVFDATPFTAIVLVIVVAIVVVVGWRLVRPAEELPTTDEPASRIPAVLAIILGSLLVLGIGAAAIVGAGGWLILVRMGLEYTLLGIAAIVLVLRKRTDTFTVGFVLLVGAVAAMFIGIQTARLLNHSDHSFFIYWDRYFFSEVLPSLFVLSGLALHLALAEAHRRNWVRPALRSTAAVAVGAVVLVAGVAATQAHDLKLLATDTYMNGAYQFQSALDRTIPNRKIPVLWTSTSKKNYPGFFFPNTWMAFARPMEVSFGYDVLDVDNRNNFGPDQVATASALEQSLSCASANDLIVFEVKEKGAQLSDRVSTPRLTITRLKTIKGTISLLSQPPLNGGWQHLSFSVTAYRVSATGTLPTCQYPGS